MPQRQANASRKSGVRRHSSSGSYRTVIPMGATVTKLLTPKAFGVLSPSQILLPRMAPTTLSRRLNELNRYGYIKVVGDTRAKGYEYEVENVEDTASLKSTITNTFDEILVKIKAKIIKKSLPARLIEMGTNVRTLL